VHYYNRIGDSCKALLEARLEKNLDFKEIFYAIRFLGFKVLKFFKAFTKFLKSFFLNLYFVKRFQV